MTDPILAAAKTALRLDARARRKALLIEHPEADWMAAEHVDAFLKAIRQTRPGVAALYRAMGSELDPRPLGEALIRRGWTLALPRVDEADGPLSFHVWAPGERLAPDAAGQQAPLASTPLATPTLVLVPLLAFDAFGGRLGQGGGYYDRTLAPMAARAARALFVGFAYSGQARDRLPLEPHDIRLDGILTEAGYSAARKEP